MKRKLIVLLIATTFALSSCGASETSDGQTIEESSKETLENTDLSEIDSIGDVEVEENLFSVELTIPADFVGEKTQDDLDAVATENGYKSITLNADGSATYVMTKAQHQEMLDEMATSINDSLAELIGSEDYPNITAITANDNFTEFTITTKSTELDMNESFSVMMFYMYGGMYGIFSGEQADNIHVDFVNADSGEIISSSNSADAGK